MFTLFGYFAIFRGFQIREANRKFNRQLDIISPYIKSKEILILKSKWARMESRIDYLEIIEEVNNFISEINKQKLKFNS